MSHTLGVLAEESFQRHGDYDSLFFEGTWFRSAELFGRSCRLAAGLVALGVSPGDRVTVVMSNGPEVGIAYTGMWRAGAVVTPVIFLVGPDELRRILRDTEARAVITSPEFLPSVRAAAEGMSTVRWIVVAGPTPPLGEEAQLHPPSDEGHQATRTPQSGPLMVRMEELELGPPGPIVPRAQADLAALMYTGGTTGRAKGVMLSHESLWWCGRSSHLASYVEGITRVIVPLPLSHAFGLVTTIVGMHNPEPAQGILMRWFEPALFLRLVEEMRAQRVALVPSMVQILLSMPLEEHDLSSLRYVNIGAAPLAVDVAREFERRVPGVEIDEGYGCTESGAVISVNPVAKRKLGSVGVPIPGCEVRIVDDEDRELAPGEVGEVCCRSPGVMQGYWQEPQLTEAALRGGWLHTGDLGRVDDDGYLWIADRRKDLIIRGGFNVFPRDVEDGLLDHPAVEAAAVVGRPDDRFGEEIVAFVSLRKSVAPAPSPKELIEFARAKLGAGAYPREIHIVPALPLTAVGKLDRMALRSSLNT